MANDDGETDKAKAVVSRKADAAFEWLIRVYAPAFLRIADLPEAAQELETLNLNHDQVVPYLRDFRKRVFTHGISKGGLPKNDPVWHKIAALGGSFPIAEAWSVANTAAAIARSTATSDTDYANIAASIGVVMKRLERKLDELLAVQEV